MAGNKRAFHNISDTIRLISPAVRKPASYRAVDDLPVNGTQPPEDASMTDPEKRIRPREARTGRLPPVPRDHAGTMLRGSAGCAQLVGSAALERTISPKSGGEDSPRE